MHIPQLFILVVTGFIMLQSIFIDDKVAHIVHEKFFGQNVPRTEFNITGYTMSQSGFTFTMYNK